MESKPQAPIRAVVFDAYGTLFDVYSIGVLAEQLFPGKGDALTGMWRDQSFGQEYVVDLSLRHDIPGTKLAWGSGYFDERFSPGLRLDAIDKEHTVGPFVTAFVEHKDVAGFTVKLSYRNLANMKDAVDRTVFVDRRGSPIAFSESRRREFGQYFQLTVTGTL